MAPIPVQSKSIPLKKLKKRAKRPSYPARRNPPASGPNTSASPAEPVNPLASQPPNSEPTASHAQTLSSAAPDAPRTSTTVDPQPPVSTGQSQKFLRGWIPLIAKPMLVITAIGVIATIVFGRHLDDYLPELMKWIKWFAHSSFTNSCRYYYQANKNKTTPDCDRALNERPQPPPERRHILKRSFGSSTDWQQDPTLAWRIVILAELGLFALCFHYKLGLGRWLYRLIWGPRLKENVEVDLPESNLRSGQCLFVGAKSDHQTYHFIELEVTDLKDGSKLLSKVAESFQIWNIYEASYRLRNLTFVKFRSLNEGALVNSGRLFPGEVTRMRYLPPPQDFMNEHYRMELINLDENRIPFSARSPNRIPLCARSPEGPVLRSSLDPLVGQKLPLHIANHGKPNTEDREEWGIILGEGETIIDKVMIHAYLETAFVTFILSSSNEIPFIFWISVQLISLGAIDGFIGLNIRTVSYKKLPITLTLFLFILTQVISPNEDKSALPQHLGLMLCRFLGSFYLFWRY